MSIEFSMYLLFVISVLVNLTTEAAKKVSPALEDKADYVAMASSVFLTVAVCAVYIIMNDVTFTFKIGVMVIVLMYLSFLVATLGYDKVMAAIKQISGKAVSDDK